MDPNKELLVKRVMGVFTIIFAIGALSFWLLPEKLIEVLNSIGSSIGFGEEAPTIANGMWVTLSVAMMVIISVLSYMVWSDPKKNVNVLLPIVVCKFTSSILGVYFFVFVLQSFAYITITLTDLPIGIIVLLMHRIATKSA
jgi:hypothetical protein